MRTACELPLLKTFAVAMIALLDGYTESVYIKAGFAK
jgi:hypothetical protein